MDQNGTERHVNVTIPNASEHVMQHHHRAIRAIESMSSSRKWGADANARSWRRWIKQIDPERDNGWAFLGAALMPGASATLPLGAIIVVCDVSWANARWYADCSINRIEADAALHEVAEEGLALLVRSARRTWGRDLVRWLTTNGPGIPVKRSLAIVRGE